MKWSKFRRNLKKKNDEPTEILKNEKFERQIPNRKHLKEFVKILKIMMSSWNFS